MSDTDSNPGPSTSPPALPASPATSPTSAAPSSPAPPSPSPMARRLWPVIAVVVVLGVILALVAAGVFSSTGSSRGGANPTYSGASAAAGPVAGAVSGGPWSLVAAAGIDTPVGATTNASTTTSSNCTFTPLGAGKLGTTLHIPAYHGQFSAGASPFWGLIYIDNSTQQVLLVAVLNGTALALATGSGSCTQTFGSLQAIPSNVVDSSTAAPAAWNDGGSAFVTAHSSLTLTMEMGLVGGGSFGGLPIGPTWVVTYSPCSAFGVGGPSGTQPEFIALIDALTGAITTATATTTVCGAGSVATPLGTVLALGNPTLLSTLNNTAGCASGDYCYHVTVEAAGPLTPDDLSLSVNSSTGALVSGVRGFAFLTLSGQVLVSSFGNPSLFWATGTGNGTSQLLAGMTVVVDMGTSSPIGSGYVLEAEGLGSYSGTVLVSLP